VKRVTAHVIALVAALIVSAPAQAKVPSCPDSVKAPSAIVIEVSTGTVACQRAADKERSIGSTTKLMTALLTLEQAKLSDTFTAADYRPLPIESQIGLQPGERMKVSDLMRGLLLESGNDAAVTLAEGVSGSRKAFVREMNKRARSLDLEHTHFANPVGLDEEGNYSSARDLVRLATVLRTNSFFKKVVDSPVATLKTGVRPRTFRNRNRLVREYGFVNGVKTGHTRGAGYVLVGSASKRGVQLISVVLGTPSENARDRDTMALFNWALPRFQRIRAVVEGRTLATAQIRYRNGAKLKLVPLRTVRRIVLRGHREAVKVAVHAPAVVEGPIRSGQRLGRVEVSQGGKLVATVPLVARGSVPAASVAQRTKSAAGTPWILFGVAFVALGATVLLARRRAQTSRRRRHSEPSAA
jgi:D-alanyl-D-alanine carboxypeptidase (penicillin-binding protein 5/6)